MTSSTFLWDTLPSVLTGVALAILVQRTFVELAMADTKGTLRDGEACAVVDIDAGHPTEQYEHKAITLSKTGGGYLRRKTQSTGGRLVSQTCYVPSSVKKPGQQTIQMRCTCV